MGRIFVILSVVLWGITLISSSQAVLINEKFVPVEYLKPGATFMVSIGEELKELPLGHTLHYEFEVKDPVNHTVSKVVIPSAKVKYFIQKIQQTGKNILSVQQV